MSIKLTFTAKGPNANKQFTVPNPVDKSDFDADDVKLFINEYNVCYGSSLSLSKAAYVTTTEDPVFPAA